MFSEGARMRPAPIAVFAYNRPQHLSRALSALQANALAPESKLYIFSDGPKGPDDIPAVEEVRKVITRVAGFADVSVQEQTENLGLAQSIINGVTELSDLYGRVIVLEDDLLVAPGFLTFMNQALEHYADVPAVMQVSGYMFPIPQALELGDVFLSRKPASWGWATWKRAWSHFRHDSHELLSQLRRAERKWEFDIDGTYPYFEMLEQHAAAKMDVWGVRWYASMFLQKGLCLYPTQSLVSNIGMDGSGTHCDPTTIFDVRLSPRTSWNVTVDIQESPAGLQMLRQFSFESQQKMRPSIVRRAINKCRQLAKG